MIKATEVRKIMAKVVKSETPLGWADDLDFRNGLVDSLDMVNFILRLEEATGLQIPDVDFDRIRTLRDVMLVLSERSTAAE